MVSLEIQFTGSKYFSIASYWTQTPPSYPKLLTVSEKPAERPFTLNFSFLLPASFLVALLPLFYSWNLFLEILNSFALIQKLKILFPF